MITNSINILRKLQYPSGLFAVVSKDVKTGHDKALVERNGELPELYFANTQEHNENSPLGWAQALYLVMMKV